MRKLLPFFACVMLVLTGWSGMAHATEAMFCSDTPQSEAILHADGDGDQVPADTDKGYPHHHTGCHGHHVGTPAADKLTALPVLNAGAFGDRHAQALAAYHAGPTLRPPQA